MELSFNFTLPSIFLRSACNVRTFKTKLWYRPDTLCLAILSHPLTCLHLNLQYPTSAGRALGGPHNISALLKVIKTQASSLVELEIAAKFLNISADEALWESPQSITMPHLKRLVLETPCLRMIACISAPMLEAIHLSAFSWSRDEDSFTSNDFPCLLDFLVLHSSSLVDFTLHSSHHLPLGWTSDGDTQTRSSTWHSAKFLRLRRVDLTIDLIEEQHCLIDMITSDMLEDVNIRLGRPGTRTSTWITIARLIQRNSTSLRTIKSEWGYTHHKIGGDGAALPVLFLPMLRSLETRGFGSGLLLPCIYSAPSLEKMIIFSKAPKTDIFNYDALDIPFTLRKFPSLCNFQLVGHFTLLQCIDAPVLDRVAFGEWPEGKGRPPHPESIMFAFLQRHSASLESISPLAAEIFDPLRETAVARLLFKEPSSEKHKLVFPRLETMSIRVGDELFSATNAAPVLSHLTIWSHQSTHPSTSAITDIQLPKQLSQSLPSHKLDASIFPSIETLEIINIPDMNILAPFIFHSRDALMDVSRLIITDRPFLLHLRTSYLDCREIKPTAILFMDLLMRPEICPRLTQLELAPPPKELLDLFCDRLKDLITARLNNNIAKPVERLVIFAVRGFGIPEIDNPIDVMMYTWLGLYIPELVLEYNYD